MNCIKCNSDKIISGLKVVDRGHRNLKHDLSLEFDQNLDVLFFKKPSSKKLYANVCGECGNVEFSIKDPKSLWEIFSQINDKNEIDYGDFKKWLEEDPARSYFTKNQQLIAYRKARANRLKRDE